MAKIKTKKEPQQAEIKPLEITGASLTDDFCNYSYKIKDGVGIGDDVSVKGKGIIEEDLKIAFSKFNMHMAAIDDGFKSAGIEVEDIDNFYIHDITNNYNVTGFKISGTEDSQSIVLVGTKFVSCGGRMEVKTPKIPLDSASSYQWYNELKAAAEDAAKEVELYKDGKCTPVETNEKENKRQLKITDQINEEEFEAGRE